jgi:hypothetical protein
METQKQTRPEVGLYSSNLSLYPILRWRISVTWDLFHFLSTSCLNPSPSQTAFPIATPFAERSVGLGSKLKLVDQKHGDCNGASEL